MSDRCERCDRPSATMVDYTAHTDGCACERCTSLCWRDVASTECEPIDWRSRALDAEAVVARLLWRSVVDLDECACRADETCALCDGARIVGLGSWTNAEDVRRWLDKMERDRG